MKILVLSYSHTGNNRLLARDLSQQLKADWEEVQEEGKRGFFRIATERMFGRRPRVHPLQHDPAAYDHVILAGPTWMGRFATPLLQVLDMYPFPEYSMISLNGGATGPNPELWDGLSPVHSAQLFINDLLPAEKRGKMMETAKYEIKGDSLPSLFTPKLSAFVEKFK